MKTFFIIAANFCFIAAYSQVKNSNRKDFKVVENLENLKAQVKQDSLNGIKSISTKKIPKNIERLPSFKVLDTLSKSKEINTSTSKKK